MSFRRRVLSTLLAGAATLLAAAPVASACEVDTQEAAQVFAQWGDDAWYVPAPGGTFEAALDGARIHGRAGIVEGGFGGGSALQLRPGSSVTLAPMCVDETFTDFRMWAKGVGEAPEVTVLHLDRNRDSDDRDVRLRDNGRGDWQLSRSMALRLRLGDDGTERIAFRLSVDDDSRPWLIDDLYVDPWRRS